MSIGEFGDIKFVFAPTSEIYPHDMQIVISKDLVTWVNLSPVTFDSPEERIHMNIKTLRSGEALFVKSHPAATENITSDEANDDEGSGINNPGQN